MHHCSVSWDITPVYFFSWNLIYFQKKEPIKVQIWWNFHGSSRKSEISHIDGLLLSKSYKVSTKKVQKSYLSWHWRMMQSLKKNWLVISNMTWVIWGIFTQPLKSLKITLTWALFVHKVYRVWAKKYRGVIFHDTEQWCTIWINPDFSLSKIAWEIRWTFITALKSLKELCE